MDNRRLTKPTDPILVIGGTGATGRLVTAQLAATGDNVRVLTRNPARARALFPASVQVVHGDLKNADDVRRALAGVRAVVMAHGSDDGKGTAEDTDYGGVLNVAQALGSSPVKLVLMSAIYVTRPEHPNNDGDPIFEWKRRAEELVRASGHPYAIARASWLVAQSSSGKGEVRLEQGDTGDGSVSYADMAKVLVQALRSAKAVGKTFEVYSDPQARPSGREPAFEQLLHDTQAFHSIEDPAVAKTCVTVVERLCAHAGQRAACPAQ